MSEKITICTPSRPMIFHENRASISVIRFPTSTKRLSKLRQTHIEIVPRDKGRSRIIELLAKRFGHLGVVARGLGPFPRQSSGIHRFDLLLTTQA
jgi:hypothetical protein